MKNLMKNKIELNEQKNKKFEDNQIMERLIHVEPNNPTLTRNQTSTSLQKSELEDERKDKQMKRHRENKLQRKFHERSCSLRYPYFSLNNTQKTMMHQQQGGTIQQRDPKD